MTSGAGGIICNNDQLALTAAKCPSPHVPIDPATSTAVNSGADKNCIVIPKWTNDFTAGRYTSPPENCAAVRAADVERIRQCTNSIDGKIADFKAAIKY
jgi:hypothetical protein